MIVELIGGSGAGKTTLVGLLARRGGTSRPLVSATELVMDRPGRRRIRHPKAMNLAADVTVLPSFLGSLGRNGEFVRFAFRRILRNAPSWFAKANYLREIARNVGRHELARRAGAGAFVLVDEGTVLTAYHLFVYSDASFDRRDLERFARLVPLPDRIVYIRAPLEVLVDRAMRRPDRRRELAFDDRDRVRRLIARAQDVFDGLAETGTIRDRILVVDGTGSSEQELGSLVPRIAAFIDEGAPADGPGAAPVSPGAQAG